MKKLIVLTLNDFKHVFRDRLLTIFLFVPVLLICFARLFVPYITEVYPVVSGYHTYIMMLGCIQTSIMFGFISAFIILEEKDENVLQVIRVLPVTPEYFIAYRFLFATFFSTLSAFCMMWFANIAWPGYVNTFMLALHYGLAAPFISLLISTYAKNKVEGLAFFKAVNLLILLPVMAFIFPGTWSYIFSIIPMYWTYQLYENAVKGFSTYPFFLMGLLVYAGVFLFLTREFKKKVFTL